MVLGLKKVFLLLTGGIVLSGLLPEPVAAHGMSEADKLAIVEGGNLRYMWLGATHMLTGYDHLLFVFGIIFFLTSFRDVVKYITAFTLGHSATLIYATFAGIQLNYFLIDAVIGLSVCYIAFTNLDGFRKYLQVEPPNMMLMIGSLGLVHGFGLSTRLQELPLSEDGLLLNIISFNVGIELGQVIALAGMLLLMAAWRKQDSFQPFSLVANYGLVVAGGLLFLAQMHGYSHDGEQQGVAMAETRRTGIVGEAIAAGGEPVEARPWQDTIRITLPRRSDKEYKFLLEKGDSIEYAWVSDDATLYYDLHAEPSGNTTGYFETFKQDNAQSDQGMVTASFAGTHGWYWKNSSWRSATIELKVRGAYKRLDIDQ